MTKLKDLYVSVISWVFVAAFIVNVAVAGSNLIDIFFTKNELVLAGKLLDSVESRAEKEGFVFYETNKFRVIIVTNDWYRQHKAKLND